MKLLLSRHKNLPSVAAFVPTKNTINALIPFLRKKENRTRQAARTTDHYFNTAISSQAERRLFTGNFFAGPVALLHPALRER
jgi:hypothetical protein